MTDSLQPEHVRKEFDEINNYMRTLFIVGITWYTFFVTANLVVVGLFLKNIFEEKDLGIQYILSVSILFMFVNALGLIACQLTVKHCRQRNRRVLELLKRLANPEQHNEISSPLPMALAVAFIRLMQCSLIAICLFWITLAIVG